MSSRISFHSAARPTRIAKAMKAALAALGSDLPFSRVREATAVMYGWRNWNDLLSHAGRSAPSPYDQEVPQTEAKERMHAYIARLSQALDIPISVAAEVIAEVGPSSRRSAAPATHFDWSEAVQRIASGLEGPIEPASSGAAEGFSFPVGRSRATILVDEAGSITWSTGRRDRAGSSDDTLFGRKLQTAGLLAGRCGTPHPLVVEVLSRVDGRAMSMLRTSPSFTVSAYEAARSLPDDAALRALLGRLPMLGAELQSLAHEEMLGRGRSGTMRDELALRRGMLASPDPLEVYLTLVERFATTTWDHLPFDRAGARRAIEAVGGIVVLEDLGLQVWHTAFLAHAPAAKLPRDPAQLRAAILFIENWTKLLRESVGLRPEALFEEFDGDWVALRTATSGERMRYSGFLSSHADVARQIAASLVDDGSCGFAPDEFDPDFAGALAAVDVLSERLTPHLAGGRGVLGLLRPYEAWSTACAAGDGTRDYEFLSSSGLLPPGLRGLAPRALLGALGIDADAFAAKLIDDEDQSIAAVEAEILSVPATGRHQHRHPEGEEYMSHSTTFHRAVIGGIAFEALLSADGPYINAVYGRHQTAGVALGHCTSVCRLDANDGAATGFHVVKYGNQSRIHLEGFGAAEVEQLRAEFGIGQGSRSGCREFWDSAAGAALVQYVKDHPRRTSRFARCMDYLGDWHAKAVALAEAVAPAPLLRTA